MKNLRELLVAELKDIYSAGIQLLKALPKMAKAAYHDEFKMTFPEHLEITQGQVNRFTIIFEELDASPRGKNGMRW